MAGNEQLFDHRFIGKGDLSQATAVDRYISDKEK
jgi:hypothetical protein